MIISALRSAIRSALCTKKLLTICLSLFYGFLVVLVSIFSIIKNRSKYFQVKRRDVPPLCLTDWQLGKHHFIQLKVLILI